MEVRPRQTAQAGLKNFIFDVYFSSSSPPTAKPTKAVSPAWAALAINMLASDIFEGLNS